MAFLFVLDTPKCKCAKAQGSRQTVSSELTPREFHPNWRSARAALIACGGLNTARTVTGREYHYALCGLWRNRGLPDIWSQYRFAHHLSSLFACRQVLAYCSARLCSSQSQRGSIWRMTIRLSTNHESLSQPIMKIGYWLHYFFHFSFCLTIVLGRIKFDCTLEDLHPVCQRKWFALEHSILSHLLWIARVAKSVLSRANLLPIL